MHDYRFSRSNRLALLAITLCHTLFGKTLSAQTPAVGAKAPNFTLSTPTGKSIVMLKELRSMVWCLWYFEASPESMSLLHQAGSRLRFAGLPLLDRSGSGWPEPRGRKRDCYETLGGRQLSHEDGWLSGSHLRVARPCTIFGHRLDVKMLLLFPALVLD